MPLFRKVATFLLLALIAAPLAAQEGIQYPPGSVLGNDTAAQRTGRAAPIGSILARGLGGMVAPQHRITLVSGLAVMGTSNSAATTVYVTPAAGDLIPIYDGTNMVPTSFAETSQATTDATKSPGAVAASKVYDIFCYTVPSKSCSRGPAWTNSTTRGYTLTTIKGIALNTSAITNGPAALRGTWMGTIASNAGSTIDFTYCAAGNGGVAGVFNVWNAYNQASISCTIVDINAAYTYTSGTVRQADGSAGMQVSFVNGGGGPVVVSYRDFITYAGALNANFRIGLGLDSITVINGSVFYAANYNTSANPVTPGVSTNWSPGIGTHYVAALQQGDTVNANTFNAQGATSINGLNFQFWM